MSGVIQRETFLQFIDEGKNCTDIEQACAEYMVDLRWPNGVVCPHCKGRNVSYIRARRGWSCSGCRRRFSVRTDTILEESRLPLHRWLEMLWILTDGTQPITSSDLAGYTGVSQKTAWFVEYRLKKALPSLYDSVLRSRRTEKETQIRSENSNEDFVGALHFQRFKDALTQILRPHQTTRQFDLMTGNCLARLRELEAESIHLALIAPPYPDPVTLGTTYLTWSRSILGLGEDSTPDFGAIPSVQRTMLELSSTIASGLHHSLIPGAFLVFFSQPHLVHHTALGLEEGGLDIVNIFVWHHTQRPPVYQPMDETLIERLSPFPTERKQARRRLRRLRKPAGDSSLELLILAQKPKQGSLIENWKTHQTGLLDIDAELLEQARSGIITVEKPVNDREEEANASKPIALMEYLIRLLSRPGQVVVDPFLGNGSGAIAAVQNERQFIGIDPNGNNIDRARRRLADVSLNEVPPGEANSLVSQ